MNSTLQFVINGPRLISYTKHLTILIYSKVHFTTKSPHLSRDVDFNQSKGIFGKGRNRYFTRELLQRALLSNKVIEELCP